MRSLKVTVNKKYTITCSICGYTWQSNSVIDETCHACAEEGKAWKKYYDYCKEMEGF